MGCKRILSRMDLRPRAPVFRSIAFFATARSASGRTSSSTPSMSNNSLYCLTKAFFGSDKIWINASSSSSVRVATTGRRPTNSGIKPYFTKSSGSTSAKASPIDLDSFFERTSAPKPMPPFSLRSRMTLSRPANAPPQMNRIFEVSTCKNSC